MGINVGAKATAKAKANEKKIKKATQHTRASTMIVVDKAHDEDDTKKKCNLKRRDSEQQIKQIRYDHLRNLSEEEFYMNEVQCKNLHDTLVEDRRLWKKGDLQMGLKYYAEKEQKFSDPASTMNMLKPTNPSDQVDDH